MIENRIFVLNITRSITLVLKINTCVKNKNIYTIYEIYLKLHVKYIGLFMVNPIYYFFWYIPVYSDIFFYIFTINHRSICSLYYKNLILFLYF